jgi:lipid-binding SYLF domain-containing protein
MNVRTTTSLASAIALALGASITSAQEPIRDHGGLDTPVHERDLDAREDVAVIERGDVRDIEERVEDAVEIAERRNELSRMADEAIDELRSENASAASLLEQAHGYAVFDTTKGGLIVTGAGGSGVARAVDSGEETYMHLAAGGVGLGAGLENYKLVMLFEDAETFDNFVTGQWDGSISAQASAGSEGAAAEEQFVGGIRTYRLTDAGLMAQVDITGMRFWPSEDLNHPHDGL